ncbi:MAG TPA: bifunctional metallophosphatase/5'-nucleotidase [Candidatus Mucispirillum faecigallinarum]|uniref:Bifunctional metallophosphatase/5'-nucleotidase n=1 Tax=Candidatus Mucispirillum faecigallinarum TaxID=2838699 RepID=A0A9D2GR87_9BACT|nr:bifunctional metallophosphatase/5'-nucleotidase [Candidatus Mucispirillum faecigallinarum]
MKKFIIIPLMIIISACSNKADNNIDNNLSLNIYHFNDIHSAETFNMPLTIDNESVSAKAGGYPRFIEALSNSDKPAYTEVIFAGDMFQQGYPLFTYTNGKYDFDMLCMSSPDIITLGNHELYETDTGILNLFFDYINANHDNCSFDIVLANVTFDNETIQNSIKPYIIKQYGNQSIAYFGVTTAESGFNNITGMKVSDPFETAGKIISEIKARGINKIIAVTHLGFEEDKKLALLYPDIDLIIGGHSHTIQGDFSDIGVLSYEKNYPFKPDNTSTYIVTAGYQGLILGNINLSFNQEGDASLISASPKMLINPLDNDTLNNKISGSKNVLLINENAAAATEIENIYSSIALDINKVVGETLDDLYTLKVNPAYSYDDHYASSLGTVFSKALYVAAANQNYAVDLAIINTGALRINLPKGSITYGMLNQAAPYANDLYVIELKGSALKEFIQSTVYNFINLNDVNSFPCLYGAEFKYDADNNILTENKILSGSEYVDIDDNKIYKVVLSSYIYQNEEIINKNVISAVKINTTDKQAYTDYIIKNSPLEKITDPIIIYKQ